MPSASGSRAFLDTNVLVYAVDRGEPRKRERASELIAAGLEGHVRYVLSTQVLQEFYAVATRKLARPLREETAETMTRELTALPVVQTDSDLVIAAIARSRRERLSIWDALIVEAALRANCDRLLSEDLQDGRVYEGRLTVEDPFAGTEER